MCLPHQEMTAFYIIILNICIISIKVGEIGKVKDLSAPLHIGIQWGV
jgi:hypothetical protein